MSDGEVSAEIVLCCRDKNPFALRKDFLFLKEVICNMQNKVWELKRLFGYILGFVLFYGPFAFFQKFILLLTNREGIANIHTLCFRIPIEHILNGRFFEMGLLQVTATVILLLVTFCLGPIFCGKLCAAGAVPEYFSRLIPDKYKIEWKEYLPVIPLRYGFFAGFLVAPLFSSYLACSYCNYFVFDLFINYVLFGYLVAFSSSLIFTALLWFIIFGIFTKGGRGFCNFFCPVGAFQNLIHACSSKLTFVRRLKINPSKCIGCGKCVKECPMQAMEIVHKKASYSVHNCILCQNCEAICPVQAITYGAKGDNDEK